MSFGVLPHSWTLTTDIREDASRKLILCSVDACREFPMVRSSIAVEEDFNWFLSVFGKNITPEHCRALHNNLASLDSVNKVVRLVSLVDSCKVCEGNLDHGSG